jgi:hypothetical protein
MVFLQKMSVPNAVQLWFNRMGLFILSKSGEVPMIQYETKSGWRMLLLLSTAMCCGFFSSGATDWREDFARPPLEYATRPLWFWNNTTITGEGIIEQMQMARDLCGYGGFGILPFGAEFKPTYLGEDYFRIYGIALERARELGMTMCLYDEYGFPSGSAGAINGDGVRRFADRYPQHTIKRLDKFEWNVTGPADWAQEIPEGRLMGLVAMRLETGERVDLNEKVRERRAAWSVPEGEWKIMAFVCVVDGDPNVDYLDPEAVNHFVEMTHQEYYDRFKEYFGTTIDGTFHDEPTMYRAQGRIWTGSFNEKFKARYGFDPVPFYPALWYDIGPETAAARNYLFGFRTELYATAFPKVIQEWSSRHGIVATGHQDQEEVVNPVSVAGDLMKCFKYQDIPGVDKIGGNRPAERFYKVISSAAYNWDKALVMSETYGAMGDISWETIYHVAMEQYTKGINQMIPHAVWYDPDAVTFKPELSWRHEKYADRLPEFNQYMSRLNLLLQNHGRHVADIAVLYPIATMQAGHYLDGTLGPYQGGVAIPEADYVDVGELLASDLCRDYTFIHPEVLDEKCSLEGDTLRLNNPINHEAYKVLIVPGHKTIFWSNLQKVKKFYEGGGKVIFTGTLPENSGEFGHDDDVAETIETIFPGLPKKVAPTIQVTASSSWPGYGPERAIDGSMATRWNAADGTSGGQWLAIEFGREQPFDRVAIKEAFDRVTAYKIQYLQDGVWKDCGGGTTLGERVHVFETVHASGARLFIDTIRSDSASIIEFSVSNGDDPLFGGEPDSPVVTRNAEGGMAVFLEKPTAENLQEALDAMLDVYDVEFEPEKTLRYIHKVYEGRHIYLFANLHDKPVQTWVKLRGMMEPECWNPHTGEISQPLFFCENRGQAGVTRIRLELPALQSVFVVSE